MEYKTKSVSCQKEELTEYRPDGPLNHTKITWIPAEILKLLPMLGVLGP